MSILLSYTSTGHLAIAVLVFGIVYVSLRIFARNRRLKRLGGAPQARYSRDPMGIDLLLDDVKQMKANRLYERYRDELLKLNHTYAHFAIGEYAVVTDEPENIKAILATQFEDFEKGERFHELWEEVLGDSIFATDGELWKSSRKLLQPQFLISRVSDLACFERNLQKLFPLLAETENGLPGDMLDLFARFTLDTATEFLFGSCVGSLENSQAQFAWAFARIQYWQAIRMVSGPLNLVMSLKELRHCIKVVDVFVNPLVQKTLNTSVEKLEEKSKTEYTFIDALALHTRDTKVLREQLMATLIAARDTVSVTLTWSMHELSRHPEIAQKLRSEVLSVVGRDRLPTYEDLKRMTYLKHVVNEVLRLYPPVPFNLRQSARDTTLPVGGPTDSGRVGMPKGTTAVYCVMSMHRRKDLVGPDAEEFRPERWETWTPKPWTYLPFNGGPRICIGQTFALAQVQYTLARIVQTFASIEHCQEKQQGFAIEILLRPEHPVLCKFRRSTAKV